MARQIAKLIPGEIVTLKFHAGYGNAEDIEQHRFIGMVPDETGLDRLNARFESIDPSIFSTGGSTYQWEAYRYAGRWCYGTSAQRLSVMSTKTTQE